MVPVALRRRPILRVGALALERVPTAVLLGAIALGSVVLRTRAMGDAFWIDEGLSVGISSFPLADIPQVLRQDGSPPLYYLLLHLWMDLEGSSEAATRVLSLVPALLTIPAGFWAGRSLFDRRTGWMCAALCALNPFITMYAQEARMYALLILLSLFVTAGFLHAFVFGRRRYLLLFAPALALMLYTHNWGLFFAAAAVLALAVIARGRPEGRRALARDGALAFGGAALAFLPWAPTLVFQALHTGAPWADVPSPGKIFVGLATALGGPGPAVGLLVAGGAGVAASLQRGRGRERETLLAIAVLAVGSLAVAWLFSQLSPAWAVRYLAVAVGPLLLLAAAALARAGRLGLATLALVAVLWAITGVPGDTQTTERNVIGQLESTLKPGDLVVSTHPERLPVLHYYLPPGLRYATTLGPVSSPGVMDWRDALPRLRRATTRSTLGPLLDSLPRGRALLIVRPVTAKSSSWDAPWTSLVRRRSSAWARTVTEDPRFVRLAGAPRAIAGETTGVRATLYLKVGT